MLLAIAILPDMFSGIVFLGMRDRLGFSDIQVSRHLFRSVKV